MRWIPLLVLVLAVAGCGKTNKALLPQANADALKATADRIQAACDAKDRSTARAEVRNAEREIKELPDSVSVRLETNLQDWIDHIQSRLGHDCRARAARTPAPTETSAPTETPTSTPRSTSTPTPSPSPTPTATETPTASATPTATATPTAAAGATP
jgi:hypothetical protein